MHACVCVCVYVVGNDQFFMTIWSDLLYSEIGHLKHKTPECQPTHENEEGIHFYSQDLLD